MELLTPRKRGPRPREPKEERTYTRDEIYGMVEGKRLDHRRLIEGTVGDESNVVTSYFTEGYYTPTERGLELHRAFDTYNEIQDGKGETRRIKVNTVLAYGTVKEGKSDAAMAHMIKFIAESPKSVYIIAAQTHDVLYRTAWTTFKSMINPEVVVQKRSEDYLTRKEVPSTLGVYNRQGEISEILWIPLDDEQKLRGPGVRGILVEEATGMDEQKFRQLRARLSMVTGDQKCMILSTNPDSDSHYLYKYFVDPITKKSYAASVHFRPGDNPYRPKEALEELMRENPPGTVWYKRFVDGIWCAADGSIWPEFDRAKYVGSGSYGQFHPIHFVGIDPGQRDPTAVVLLSVTLQGIVHVRCDYAAAGKATPHHTSEIMRLLSRKNLTPEDCTFVCDASALDFSTEIDDFTAGRIKPIKSKSKDKLGRVRRAYALLLMNRIMFSPECVHLLSEIPNLIFRQKGVKETIVGADHAFDAFLYALEEAIRAHNLLDLAALESKDFASYHRDQVKRVKKQFSEYAATMAI